MAFILDQLLAIVIGAILIVTLLTLQFRERQAAISTTIGHTVRKNMNETLSPVADDIENMWSPLKAGNGSIGIDTFQTGPYVGLGLTENATFPARVLINGIDSTRAMAQVTYELIPIGSQANVSGQQYDQFALVRSLDFSPDFGPNNAPPGTDFPNDTLARLLIDFKLGYIEGLSSGETMLRSGGPTDLVHAFHLSALGARPSPDSTIDGRTNRTPYNAAPYSKTQRLLNF